MKLEIWVEFASTYSYLTVARIEQLLKRAPVELVWRPFLLGPIFRAKGIDTSPFESDQVKGAYMWRDVARRCEKYGIPFNRPPIFPANSLRAARVMTAALAEPWCGDFARSIFAAQFVDGKDISDENVVRVALDACDVPSDVWLDRAALSETKLKLRETTEQARNHGIFGAPSFLVAEELFWGDDRLEDAIAFAQEVDRQILQYRLMMLGGFELLLHNLLYWGQGAPISP